MTPQEIQALLDLQELDLKLLEYERHQKELPKLLAAIDAPLEKATAARDKLQSELDHAQSQHRDVESELKDNNEQFKRLQTRQMRVTNQVEYEAIQQEMESLKDRQDALEEAGLRWMELESTANEQMPTLAEEFESAEKSSTDSKATLDEKTIELKRIHDEASELQAPLLEQVPNQVLSYYRRLRRAGKAPFVAVVKRDACAGCGFRHPPQKLQEIKRNAKMMTCEQCGRIQVWKEEEESIGF